jgi:hypothetical protein
MGGARQGKRQGSKPRAPWFVEWMSATYPLLPPQVKFVLWVLTFALVQATGILPAIPHLPPDLSWL